MRRAVFLVLWLLFVLAACKEQKTVVIGFGGGTRTPVAFRCKDDQGRFIITRAVRDRTLRFSLLIDFVELSGVPSCRVGDIAEFCASGGCTPLAVPERVCVPLERAISSTENAVQTMGDILRELDGPLITDDAPHQPVIIRAVATAQTCDEVAGVTAVDPAKLIGCAVSCPVQLGGVSGEVLLDLPTLSDTCATGVVACATGAFGQ